MIYILIGIIVILFLSLPAMFFYETTWGMFK